MSQALETRADCSRCAALCCIAYPSEDMPGFAAVKEAGEPCPKLAANGLCTIYEKREEEGFSGCIKYECFGAGQHVVQSLFSGRDWRDDPALLGPLVSTFLAMRPVSDLAYLVELAMEAVETDQDTATLLEMREELAQIASSRANLADQGRIARAEATIKRIYGSIGRAKFRES